MENFPQSAIGLPATLKYELPPSLSDNARSYAVAVAPDGISLVTGTAIANPFTAASGGSIAPFVQNIVSFTIPCGQGAGIFLDPRDTILNFRLSWTISTTFAGGTANFTNMIGSASSWFDSLTLYHNNTPLEIVQNYNLLFNQLLNATVNSSERQGSIGICMGCDDNTNAGIDLPPGVTGSAGTYYFNFAIPLISIIGLNSDKLIPVGSIQNLQLQMMTAATVPVAFYGGSTAPTSGAFGAPVLDQFTLNMKYVDIGQQASALLSQTLQDGKWFIKSKTYTNSNALLAQGSSGTTSLLLQIRNSSINSLYFQFGTSGKPLVCPNGNYDAVNPALIGLQCSVGGNKFPNKQLNVCQRPAEAYSVYAQAWGASSVKGYGGVMSRSGFGAAYPLYAGGDNMGVLPGTALRVASNSDTTTQNVVSYPNMCYLGFDLQRVSGSLFSGINTRSTPPYLDLNIGSATLAPLTCFAWGMSDVVLVIDVPSKHIQAFV